MVEEGQPAPDFELESDTGKRVRLSGLRGRPVVLYFYPRDDSLSLFSSIDRRLDCHDACPRLARAAGALLMLRVVGAERYTVATAA
ncbi:MAG: redoxin domain-containing protein [Gaiellaceae bacterium]